MASSGSGARFGYVTPENLALFTDRYELSMLQGYRLADHDPVATFDLFARSLPPDRGYLLAAGLEQAVHYVESLSFGDRALSYLADLGFDPDFLSWLESFEFTGEIRALPEGTPVFPDEPILEVTAPISEAQLLETLLLNQVGFQTLVATKAARMVEAVERHGDDQELVDFGSRRAHGTDAGMKAARAAAVGGFDGTSNVAAAEAFDLRPVGTMAHSWVQSFESERAAFEAFVDVYGADSVLLVDTYDTVAGVETALDVARDRETSIRGVRLDSGDLAALSKEVADRLDDEAVFVSSGMDEYAIASFLRAGGVADGFGPGTALVTSADAPTVEVVYKLVAVGGADDPEPTMKLSTGKTTHPGRKSVRRLAADEGDAGESDAGESDGSDVNGYGRDVLGLRDEDLPGAEQLVTVVEDGAVVRDLPDLPAVRERARRERRRLPAGCRALRDPDDYPVAVSDGLGALTTELRQRLEAERG